MKFVNKYLRNFTPYKIASHKIWTVEKEERKKILKLDWNEATISPSPKVHERLKGLIEDGEFYNYYPSTFNKELLVLLASYVGLPQDNVQYFASSDSLHEYIAKLYITVGDPVMIVGPTYDNFRLTAEVCGADLFYYNMDDKFSFIVDKFKERMDEVDPSLVYVCNPNNPTGTQYLVSDIQSLIEDYPQVLFLIDEAYSEFSGISAKSLVLNHENILISRTMSKAFAMANFRFGYLLASKNNIDYISSIRNPKNITTFAQEAAIGALSDIEYMREYVDNVNDAKQYFIDELKKYADILAPINGEGNFVLVKCSDSMVKQNVIQKLQENNIYVRDVTQTEFLRERCFRITIGLKEQMKYVLDCIEEYYVAR